MNKTQFALILCKILVSIILMTMLSVKKVNVVGLVLIFCVVGYYVWNDTVNPLLGKANMATLRTSSRTRMAPETEMSEIPTPLLDKVVIFVIAYVLIVAAVGFFWNVSVELPDFGFNVLLSQLDLSKNLENYKKIIDFTKIKLPESDKYTYSFSIKVEEFKDLLSSQNSYIFYRNESLKSTIKNIGLKLAKSTTEIYDTMQLEYVTSAGNVTQDLATIPIGQWTQIVFAVNGNCVNVFVGGNKLTKQLTINNLKIPSIDAPIQFGNMPAYLADFSYSPSVIEPSPSFFDYFTKTDDIII